MSRKNKCRRSILYASGASLASLIGSSRTTVAEKGKTYDFDPSDRKEVVEFVRETDPINTPGIGDQLTKAQEEAVLEVYTDVEWEYESSTEEVESIDDGTSGETLTMASTDGNPGYTHITAYGSTPAGTREYTFNANFSWEWYGHGDGYSNVNSDSNGKSNALFGSYVSGSRTHGKTTIWDSYFHAYETGQFELKLGTTWSTVTAKVKIRGDEEGDHNTLEKSAPL